MTYCGDQTDDSPTVTGTLRNASRVPRGLDVRAPCLRGQVYGDIRGRFIDGEWITTSTIMSESENTFKTRYSVYVVESWSHVDHANQPSMLRAEAINDLVSHFHRKSTQAGWWTDLQSGQPISSFEWSKYAIATRLMLCVSELSEAMEGLRKDLMDEKLPHRKMGEVELADAAIRIFDLAGELGYDLGGAIMEKDAYNSSREDHKIEARMASGGKAY